MLILFCQCEYRAGHTYSDIGPTKAGRGVRALPRLTSTRYAECGLQVAVKYCITVYLHAENNCCISMFSPCRSFDNPVAKCFPSENALFRGSIYSVRYGSLCRTIGHSASVFRAQDNSVSGKLGYIVY